MTREMTTAEARRTVKHFAESNNLTYAKLSAKTTSFTDLARCSRIVVSITGIVPGQDWTPVREALRGTNAQLNLPLVFLT